LAHFLIIHFIGKVRRTGILYGAFKQFRIRVNGRVVVEGRIGISRCVIVKERIGVIRLIIVKGRVKVWFIIVKGRTRVIRYVFIKGRIEIFFGIADSRSSGFTAISECFNIEFYNFCLAKLK